MTHLQYYIYVLPYDQRASPGSESRGLWKATVKMQSFHTRTMHPKIKAKRFYMGMLGKTIDSLTVYNRITVRKGFHLIPLLFFVTPHMPVLPQLPLEIWNRCYAFRITRQAVLSQALDNLDYCFRAKTFWPARL
jgi:hypothetical protein